MTDNSERSAGKTYSWNNPNDALKQWEDFDYAFINQLTQNDLYYLFNNAEVDLRNPGIIPPLAELAAGANQAAVSNWRYESDKIDRRNVTIEKKRDIHVANGNKATAYLQAMFTPDCMAAKQMMAVRMEMHAADPRTRFLAMCAKLTAEFKPNKPLNAQYYLDKFNNLNSVDGRGWATYRTEFEDCIEHLEGMNQPVPIANILNCITRTLKHPNLAPEVHVLIMLMKTDTENQAVGGAPPVIPRWRSTMMNCSTIIGTSPHWDVLSHSAIDNKAKTKVNVAKAKFKANIVVTDNQCIRCGRHGHKAKDCMSKKCGICHAAIPDGARHDIRRCTQESTAPQGGGRAQGGGRDQPGRGGRGGRDSSRGGRGGGRSSENRSYYEPSSGGRGDTSRTVSTASSSSNGDSSYSKRGRDQQSDAKDDTVFMAAKMASAMWAQYKTDAGSDKRGQSSKDAPDEDEDEEFIRAALAKKRKYDGK